jgi:hypothetical protein
MTARHDLDRMLDAFLTDGPSSFPTHRSTRSAIAWKRHDNGSSSARGGFPDMSKLVPIGLGVAALVVAIVVGARLLGPAPAGPGTLPSAQPTATPTPSVAAPSPSASSAIPPLTGMFTTGRNGISIAYPTGWVTRPPLSRGRRASRLHIARRGHRPRPGRQAGLWIAVALQPIGISTPDEWVARSWRSMTGAKQASQSRSTEPPD